MRASFEAFAGRPFAPVVSHAIFLTTHAGVVLSGIKKIERVAKALLPLLFAMMLVFIVRGLMLSGRRKSLLS